jgi:hypothetical protein
MDLLNERFVQLGLTLGAGLLLGYYSTIPPSSSLSSSPQASVREKYDKMVVRVVKEFLHSQSLRDLDLMCSLVTDGMLLSSFLQINN